MWLIDVYLATKEVVWAVDAPEMERICSATGGDHSPWRRMNIFLARDVALIFASLPNTHESPCWVLPLPTNALFFEALGQHFRDEAFAHSSLINQKEIEGRTLASERRLDGKSAVWHMSHHETIYYVASNGGVCSAHTTSRLGVGLKADGTLISPDHTIVPPIPKEYAHHYRSH